MAALATFPRSATNLANRACKTQGMEYVAIASLLQSVIVTKGGTLIRLLHGFSPILAWFVHLRVKILAWFVFRQINTHPLQNVVTHTRLDSLVSPVLCRLGTADESHSFEEDSFGVDVLSIQSDKSFQSKLSQVSLYGNGDIEALPKIRLLLQF
ncbi:unnamed protein product [Cuscuta epithymum]|uniref:Uncharacterized protein n=1 Tax=Cuscuta epithymum TaxID=186058 RepID=A0AAV0CW09_9ASTE|nr:unnamed protein product [Cuscuta epithymum]